MKYLGSWVSLVAGCAVSGGDVGSEWEQESGATQYVNIVDFASTDQGAWYDLDHKLNDAFAKVCGDTFCGGDFANLTPLSFYCSVSSKVGNVHDCAWTFAASQYAVDAASGALSIDPVTYQCHVRPKTTAAKLIARLAASPDALHEPLPGTTAIYDALVDCFTHPINATPLTATTSAHPTYVEAADYYTTLTNQQKWRDSYAALKLGFDHICGDTFCGGDYSDLQSLDVACAITKSSGNVKTCTWTFGGSYTLVKKTGDLDLSSKTWSCPVAVHGTLPQLISTLTTANPADGVHRALPGGVAAYDSIAGCVGR